MGRKHGLDHLWNVNTTHLQNNIMFGKTKLLQKNVSSSSQAKNDITAS